MLIEVMVGALILAITTTAVLNGLDGAQKTGGRNKARSVAAALAEQDQERMRSMPVADLLPLGHHALHPPRDGQGRQLHGHLERQLRDRPGLGHHRLLRERRRRRRTSGSCPRSPRRSRAGNVDLVGLVTPPASSGYAAGQGRLIVKVFDRDDVGDRGRDRDPQRHGARSPRRRTRRAARSSRSCPAGNYTAAISKLGALVGWDGESTLSKALTATAGQTTTYGAYYLDAAGHDQRRSSTPRSGAPRP